MESKTSQTQLSPEFEKILKDVFTNSTNQQERKLACQRSEDSREPAPQDRSESKKEGWFGVQTLLLRAESNDINETVSAFLDDVDDSHYSLFDWLEALLRFDSWLSAKEIEARPLAAMIGYIHCCTMTSAETLAPPELAKLVEENLNQWGFDAAQPVSVE